MAYFQTENLWVSQLEHNAAAIHLDVQNRPVNVLSSQVLDDLNQALDRISADKSFRMVFLRSSKVGTFIAGADIHEFSEIATAEQATAISKQGQQLFNKLANLDIPSVAVITGACLGGGLELAMACDYRFVVDDPKVQMGLPEVELGLIPAWGGTQRLPRIVGLEWALRMILSGRRVRGREAVAIGLADRLIDSAGWEPDSDVAGIPKQRRLRLPYRNWRQRLIESNPFGRGLVYKTTTRYLHRRVPEEMPAPWEAMNAVRIGLQKGIEAGLKAENKAAGELAVSPACRNLVSVFLAREKARKVSKAEIEKPIRTVGVVGAGAMGAGIAQLAALRGFEVVIQELNESSLGMALFQIVGLFEQAAKRGVLSQEDLARKMAAVHGSTKWKGFDGVDLVIEAVAENLEIKRKIFAEIEEKIPESAIIATNTSSLLVHDLQDGLHNPGRIAGLHFFNPVHKMPLVEIVRTAETNEDVNVRLRQFAIALGKTPVLVRDSHGFVVNRILMPYLNEAVWLVSEGARIGQIDQIMRHFGMPMGPLELLDQIGLDVAAHVAKAMAPVFGDRITPHPGFQILCDKGWLGQKSRRGFYHYRGRRKKVNLLAENTLQILAKESGLIARGASNAVTIPIARERMVGLSLNEAAACMGKNLVEDAETLNLAMIMGTGWAPHRGGPMKYAEDIGYDNVVASLRKLAQTYGDRFEPNEHLINLVAKRE